MLAISASAFAIALSSLFIYDQFHASLLRADGTPISFLPYEVLGDDIPKTVRLFFDLPAYWTVFLFVEFAAFYPIGVLFAVRLAKEKLGSEARAAAIAPLGVLAAVSLGVASVMVSTMAANNDLAWRGVLPAILVLIIFAAAGFGRFLPAIRPPYAVAAVGLVALGLLSGVRVLHENFDVRLAPSAKRFVDAAPMWAAVRNHSAPGDRVANNPLFLADMTPWPINISWALLANRRSCYAGADLALPFAPLTRQRRAEVQREFERLFSGDIARAEVDQIAETFNCTLVVVTPQDGAWTTGPLALNSPYQLVESRRGAWRIYKIRPEPAK
jgi:hypothetical protein